MRRFAAALIVGVVALLVLVQLRLPAYLEDLWMLMPSSPSRKRLLSRPPV